MNLRMLKELLKRLLKICFLFGPPKAKSPREKKQQTVSRKAGQSANSTQTSKESCQLCEVKCNIP